MFGGENEFTMNNILGVKWKLTSEKGEKGEVKYTMVKDTLYVTLKGFKFTKGKSKTFSTELTT